MDTARDLLYRDLTGVIIEAAYKVHNSLGCGLLEAVYEKALSWELECEGRKVSQQKEFKVFYRDKEVGVYFADLIIESKVIVEVKAVEKVTEVHKAQLLNYLRISGIRVGLVINFAKPRLEYKRLVV
jgi:GxxExxY protein